MTMNYFLWFLAGFTLSMSGMAIWLVPKIWALELNVQISNVYKKRYECNLDVNLMPEKPLFVDDKTEEEIDELAEADSSSVVYNLYEDINILLEELDKHKARSESLANTIIDYNDAEQGSPEQLKIGEKMLEISLLHLGRVG